MGIGLGLGIQFYKKAGARLSAFLTWGQSVPARFWGTETPEYWGGLDAQAEVHYNRVIADGGIVPAGLGGVNSFFQVVKAVYETSDINTAISAAYDPHYLGYRLGAGSGTTLGQAAQKMYAPKGIFGGIGTGSAYWEGVGVTGNYVQTPSAAINQITGDIEIVARISISDEVGEKVIISKRSGANASYVLSSTSKSLRFRINTTTYDSNASHTFAVNEIYWAKVTRQQSNGEIKFFTSLNGTTWTQLGTTIVGITDSIAVNSVPVIVGVLGDLNSFSMKGNIYQATIANSIGGTPVVNFNANQYTGANTWTSTTGEVWTVNSTGAGLADVTQTTAASQPLLLAHTGENYYQGVGVANNFVSTPNASANQITNDIELTAQVSLRWQSISATDYDIIGKWSAAAEGYILRYNGSARTLVLVTNLGGFTTYSSTATIASSNDTILWVRVTRQRSNGEVKFFTSTDGVTYTQLGATVAGSTAAITVGSSVVEIGSRGVGVTASTIGKIYRATIANSIGGTPVVDFNPSSYNPATSQTQWTSATGEVWSINVGTAATGYKSALVTKSIVQGDGVDDRLASGTLATRQYFTRYAALNYLTLQTPEYIIAGNPIEAHLIYTNTPTLRFYNTAGEIAVNGAIANNLQLITGDYNGASSRVRRNNAADVTGTTGAATSTIINLFSSGAGTLFSNSIITTLVDAIAVNNDSQKTSMYNALRGFDNNAY